LKNRFFLFLFLFILLFSSCAQTHIGTSFYRGLLIRAENQDADVVSHFEDALKSSNVYVRQAAAEELARLMAEGTELSAKTRGLVRRELSGYWAAAFDAVENTPDRKKVLSFLLNFEQETVSYDEARLFVLRECERKRISFTAGEYGAIEGHYAISYNNYAEALSFFRAFQEDDEWPEHLPEIFLEHPNLINGLGRAFQFTATGDEGLELFLRWDKNLEGDSSDLRYRLLFFAARIARRRGNDERALSLFEQARLLSPDEEQSDACIWYILDISANKAFDVFIGRLEQYVPYFSTGSFFDDILERFLQRLVSEREWERTINVFSVIKNSGAAEAIAGYAWIIARVIEEGYVDKNGILLTMREANVAEGLSAAFKQISYDAGIRPLYYRRLSASALEKPFLVFPGETSSGGKPSPALEFILGFFKNDAAALCEKYIAAVEDELSPDELRAVAEALAQAGMYAQSLWLVGHYINNEDYDPLGIDMELWFPRPFRELVEKYAKETGFAPALLFGLIRTESAFQSGVISRAGAVGLMQLMPETAQETAEFIRRAGGPDYAAGEDGLNLSDPEQNIHIGAYYLNYLNARFEDILLSLLSYNGGMNRIRRLRSASTMPVDLFLETIAINETRNYGKRVMAAAAVYEELYYRQD
jgi:soluble lytic murein transglycosylase